MTVRLHNTLTKQTGEFESQESGKVKLYTCGPTVYNYLTVGNWVAYIAWDTLVRVLQADGYAVERVMNITDVGHLVSDADDGEDKLEKGAKREGKTAWEVAEFYGSDFLQGMQRLNLLMPEHITKATEYIPQQLELVRTLKGKGFTYQIDDGIYFDTSKFPTYADFAGLDLDAQRAGARVAFNDEKRSPSDFALWKFTPAGEKRDMEWPTPADLTDDGMERPGFPGWHLECSAMAMDILGSTLDIHTGGIDHIPVHHTNEIAQSEAATGKTFSKYWLHNNHLKVDGTKISKSLGNGYTLDDLKERGFSPLDYRMFVLQSHYRSEGNFTFENLDAAKNRLRGLQAAADLKWQPVENGSGIAVASLDGHKEAISKALNDDLNTPQALTHVSSLEATLQASGIEQASVPAFQELLDWLDTVLGLALANRPDITDEQKALMRDRTAARDAKDWATSDTLRDALAGQGIVLRDGPNGTVWERA